MKFYFKSYYLFFVLTLLFVSCQKEAVDVEEPSSEEILTPNSNLSNLIQRTSANNVSRDDILDNSSCFSVELPVTVKVSDITITIETEDDFDELEDILEDFEGEIPEFFFPITLISADYIETLIENQSQLEALLGDCEEQDDTIECVDFVYPISFSTLNIDFVIIDTINIESNKALYDFLESLNDDATLVALNFPVILRFANGETQTVNSNTELSNAISSVGDDCQIDDFSNCDEGDVRNKLKECVWNLDDEFNDLTATFNENFTLKITAEDLQEPITGRWEVTSNDNSEVLLTLSNLTALNQDLEGEWLVVECEDDEIKIIKNDFELTLEKDCEVDNPFECFENFDAFIELCDENNDGVESFNLAVGYSDCASRADMISYYLSLEDAENNINPIVETESYTNTSVSQIIYVRVEIDNEFQVFELELKLVNCNTSACAEADLVGTLKNCEWKISSLGGDDSFNIFNINFMDDNVLVIMSDDNTETYDGNWTTVDDGYIFLEFTNIFGGNAEVLNGINFEVVECSETQIILHDVTDSANELVLDKNCD